MLVVGCDNSTEPEDMYPLVGIWEGIERTQYGVQNGDTVTVLIDSTNGNLTFNNNYTFISEIEGSYGNNSYEGTWKISNNQIILQTDIYTDTYDYEINSYLLLKKEEYPIENSSALEITILKYWKPKDCLGVAGGTTVEDNCGVCDGDNYIDEICGNCSVHLWGECYSIENTTSLDLNDNNLTGKIPTEIGELTNLNALWLAGNQLTSIPESFCDIKKMV